MLHQFLHANRTELIERCRAKVARRPAPRPTPHEMEHGIPLFLGQLIDTLRIEEFSGSQSWKGSGPSGLGVKHGGGEMGATAAKHGGELLRQGFTVDQVVLGYGDLCQAVTEVAIEKNEPVTSEEFQTLNRCLDNAIADAVTEFGWQRDRLISEEGKRATSEQFGVLAHELRNFLNTAMLAFAAMKGGGVGLHGATSAVLERSFIGLRDLINHALAEVRLAAGVPLLIYDVAVDKFIAEVQVAASLEAITRGCEFNVSPVEPGLVIHVDQQMLYSAVSNLLQNAFKFTRSHGRVSLQAYATGDRVLIEVEDRCGGLPEGKAEAMFHAFEQHNPDRSGLGLGLSISRRAVEASGGKLGVRDMPGVGCVFTIDLPRQGLRRDKVPRAAVTHAPSLEEQSCIRS